MPTVTKRQRLFDSSFKSVHWLFLNSLFGLSPIIIGFGLSLMFTDIKFSYDYIIASGSVLFFCATITGSAMVDYILSDTRFSKRIDSNLYLIPLSLVLVAGILFGQLAFHPETKPNNALLLKLQNYIIFVALFYCFILKTALFIKKK